MLCVATLCPSALAVGEDPVVAINDNGGEFSSLKEAVEETYNNDFGGTVTLIAEDTLSEELIIPNEITVIIPSSEAHNDTDRGNNVSGNGTEATPYTLLTVSDTGSIVLEGTLLVAGNQQSTQPRSGFLTGSYASVELNGKITVASGGTLRARGNITGAGSITVEAGGSVYERFEIADWRGGTASLAANTAGVFPFSLYQLGGIDVETTYNNGSFLYGQSYIYASNTDVYVTVNYLGTNGLVKPVNGGGTVTMTKSGDVTTASVTGSFETGNLSFEIYILGFRYPISSQNKDCPFGYHFKLDLADGANVTVNGKLKILPGCTISLADNATMNISEGSAIYFYGEDTYKAEYFYHPYGTDWDFSAAAKLVNEGTGIVNNHGTVGSTDPNFTNVDGFVAAETTPTLTVLEYDQSASKAVSVPFYLGTLDTTTN